MLLAEAHWIAVEVDGVGDLLPLKRQPKMVQCGWDGGKVGLIWRW